MISEIDCIISPPPPKKKGHLEIYLVLITVLSCLFRAMEQSLMPRSLWTNDSKFLHHHAPDFFTSVQVTQDIPAGVSFGPCVLHNTFYDTIAFIALKSFDRGGKSYVFRVSY